MVGFGNSDRDGDGGASERLPSGPNYLKTDNHGGDSSGDGADYDYGDGDDVGDDVCVGVGDLGIQLWTQATIVEE